MVVVGWEGVMVVSRIWQPGQGRAREPWLTELLVASLGYRDMGKQARTSKDPVKSSQAFGRSEYEERKEHPRG